MKILSVKKTKKGINIFLDHYLHDQRIPCIITELSKSGELIKFSVTPIWADLRFTVNQVKLLLEESKKLVD